LKKQRLSRLRIIGGEHRSRIVTFDGDAGVRPTPDRVRQVVFDWLAPIIEGAHCLDLFAGSGAMGFEALSRGAGMVTLVETGRTQIELIEVALVALKAQARALLHAGDALRFLEQTAERFDVVFLDPPYGSALLAPALERLPRVLKSGHRIYLEWPAKGKPVFPGKLQLIKEKQAGQVSYALATFSE
jgi:16S rRNA (guanine966-N2)-methyltransferase